MICLKLGHIECQKCANTLSGLMTVTRKKKRKGGAIYTCAGYMISCCTFPLITLKGIGCVTEVCPDGLLANPRRFVTYWQATPNGHFIRYT